MAEQPDRQRLRPTREGQARLLADVAALRPEHVVDSGALGEYAEVLLARGQAAADAAFPDIAAHLEEGCTRCDDDLDDLLELLDDPDDQPGTTRPPVYVAGPAASSSPLPPVPPPLLASVGRAELEEARAMVSDVDWDDDGDAASGGKGDEPSDRAAALLPPTPQPASPVQWAAARPASREDSGVYAPNLPDPRAVEAEAARRQRLRRIRDILLIAAAVSALVIGLTLVGLAYLARQAPGPVQVPLVPQQPASGPAQQSPALAPAPAQQPQPGSAPAPIMSSAGRAAPEGLNCPASHPIKGNRESMIYHQPGGMSYAATRPEVCFALPADAEADGYRRSQR